MPPYLVRVVRRCSKVDYSGPSVTHSGFTHLENEVVQVLADGFIHPDVTVSNTGVITLNYAARCVIAGKKFASKLQPVRIVEGAGQGSALGSVVRIDRIEFEFYRTAYASFGRDSSNQEVLEFRPPDLAMSLPVPLYTGEKVVDFTGDNDRSSRVLIFNDSPLPMTVVSMTIHGATNES